MSAIAHGVDLVHVPRIERIWREHGDAFLERIFTAAERTYCLDCRTPALRLAGRFAVKEGVFKCLGTGWRGGLAWTEIETLPDAMGKPIVTLAGECASLARQIGIGRWLVSISHAGEYAMASVISLQT
jgi:holo-[acyl-carrier protein] synthase